MSLLAAHRPALARPLNSSSTAASRRSGAAGGRRPLTARAAAPSYSRDFSTAPRLIQVLLPPGSFIGVVVKHSCGLPGYEAASILLLATACAVRCCVTAAPSALTHLLSRLLSPPQQHKNEAKAFYAFLSQVYDYVVNPGHWTIDMRTDALAPAQLDSPDLTVVDVGGGTGFCTQGVVAAGIPPTNITLIDQSPQVGAGLG